MRTVRVTRANWLNDWIAGDDGAVRFLTDQQAYEAVEVHQLAVYIDDGPDISVLPAQAVPVVTIEPGLQFPEEPRAAAVPEDSGTGPAAELKMPWSNAAKADWVNWAAHGDHGQSRIPEQDAVLLSKRDLMARYGERL